MFRHLLVFSLGPGVCTLGGPPRFFNSKLQQQKEQKEKEKEAEKEKEQKKSESTAPKGKVEGLAESPRIKLSGLAD